MLTESDTFIYIAKGTTSSDSKLIKMLNTISKGSVYGPPSTDAEFVNSGVFVINAEMLRKAGIEIDNQPTLHNVLDWWRIVEAKKYENKKFAVV